jgi:hypothetical protein
MHSIYEIYKLSSIFYKTAIDFAQLGNRARGSIVVSSQQGSQLELIYIHDLGDKYKVLGSIVIAYNTALVSKNHSRKDWPYKIATVFAKKNIAAAYLFGAALGTAGSLVSDTTVSPAAQILMKGYYEKNKDNADLVVPEVLAEQTWNVGAPWLRAGYLGRSLGHSYEGAFAAGRDFLKHVPLEDILKTSQNLWYQEYGSNDKTGIFVDPKQMRQTNWLAQQGVKNPEEILAKLEKGEEVDWNSVLPDEKPKEIKPSDLHLLPTKGILSNPDEEISKKKNPLDIF